MVLFTALIQRAVLVPGGRREPPHRDMGPDKGPRHSAAPVTGSPPQRSVSGSAPHESTTGGAALRALPPSPPTVTGMDLRDWIIGDLKSLRAKLDGGVLGLITPERRRERPTAEGSRRSTCCGTWLATMTWPSTACCGAPARWSRAGPATSRLDDDLWRGLAESEDVELVDMLEPEAVGAYALEVIEATVGWLDDRGLPQMDQRPDTAAALEAIGTPPDRFDWLYSSGRASPPRGSCSGARSVTASITWASWCRFATAWASAPSKAWIHRWAGRWGWFASIDATTHRTNFNRFATCGVVNCLMFVANRDRAPLPAGRRARLGA